MLSKLWYMTKCVSSPQILYGLSAQQPPMKIPTARIGTTRPLAKDDDKTVPDIVDIDANAMMDEDYNFSAVSAALNAGRDLAPLDIDPWEEEDEARQDTLQYGEAAEKKEPYEYPAIPPSESRSGVYEFKGLKIRIPKKDLQAGTYRYRLTPEDENSLADDLRICKFDK